MAYRDSVRRDDLRLKTEEAVILELLRKHEWGGVGSYEEPECLACGTCPMVPEPKHGEGCAWAAAMALLAARCEG